MPNRSGIELTRDNLPMWRWARLATPEFFNRIPEIPLENLPPEFGLAVVATEENKAAEEEPKKEKHSDYKKLKSNSLPHPNFDILRLGVSYWRKRKYVVALNYYITYNKPSKGA